MTIKLRIQDRDRGASRLQAVLDELERGVRVSVGVHEDVGAEPHRGPSEATVVQVAVAQEFGGSKRPPRSWLRATIDEQRAKIESALVAAGRRAAKSAIYGSSPSGHVQRAYGRVGTRFANQVKRAVRRFGLLDTRHLLESIEGRVNGERVDASEGG